MDPKTEYKESIQAALEAVSGALDAIDAAENGGVKVHPSVINRVSTAKLILSEIMAELNNEITLNSSVRAWYVASRPDDIVAQNINPNVTFEDIVLGLNINIGGDVYALLGVEDSLIRENVFMKLSDMMGLDYDVIYKKWLRPKESPSIPLPGQSEVNKETTAPGNFVKCARNGAGEVEDVPFESLRKGDIFFVNGLLHVAGSDAHYSGDASYDGYLIYDTNDNGWFPEDLDKDVPQVSVGKNPPKRSLNDQIQGASKTAAGNTNTKKVKDPTRFVNHF